MMVHRAAHCTPTLSWKVNSIAPSPLVSFLDEHIHIIHMSISKHTLEPHRCIACYHYKQSYFANSIDISLELLHHPYHRLYRMPDKKQAPIDIKKKSRDKHGSCANDPPLSMLDSSLEAVGSWVRAFSTKLPARRGQLTEDLWTDLSKEQPKASKSDARPTDQLVPPEPGQVHDQGQCQDKSQRQRQNSEPCPVIKGKGKAPVYGNAKQPARASSVRATSYKSSLGSSRRRKHAGARSRSGSLNSGRSQSGSPPHAPKPIVVPPQNVDEGFASTIDLHAEKFEPRLSPGQIVEQLSEYPLIEIASRRTSVDVGQPAMSVGSCVHSSSAGPGLVQPDGQDSYEPIPQEGEDSARKSPSADESATRRSRSNSLALLQESHERAIEESKYPTATKYDHDVVLRRYEPMTVTSHYQEKRKGLPSYKSPARRKRGNGSGKSSISLSSLPTAVHELTSLPISDRDFAEAASSKPLVDEEIPENWNPIGFQAPAQDGL